MLSPDLSYLLAFIDGIGSGELMLVFLIVLLLFGGKKMPEFARGLGKSVREFKRAASGVEDQIKRAIDEAAPPEPKRDWRPKNTSLPLEKAKDTPPEPAQNAPKDFLS